MDLRKNLHIFEGEKEKEKEKEMAAPKNGLENLLNPKKALETLVDSAKALDNLLPEELVDPKKALDGLLPDSPFNKPENKDSDNKRELKHLKFVRVIWLNALVVALKVYEYVKGKSGPFKFGLDIGERVFKSLFLPPCKALKSEARELLVFLDGKGVHPRAESPPHGRWKGQVDYPGGGLPALG